MLRELWELTQNQDINVFQISPSCKKKNMICSCQIAHWVTVLAVWKYGNLNIGAATQILHAVHQLSTQGEEGTLLTEEPAKTLMLCDLTQVGSGFSHELEIQIICNQHQIKTLISWLGVNWHNSLCANCSMSEILKRKQMSKCLSVYLVYWSIWNNYT